MVTYEDFIDYRYLASIFYRLYHFNAIKLLSDLYNKYPDRFDGEPVIIPFQDGAPQDLPRVILKNRNKAYSFEVSNIRCNISLVVTQAREMNSSMSNFLRLATELFESFKNSINIPIGRIAFVLERIAYIEDPGLNLAKHFCKDDWIGTVLNRPARFEIHAFKRYKMNNDFPIINSWVRHKSFSKKTDLNTKEEFIHFEHDLNTLQEFTDSEDYDIDKIRSFYEAVPNEMNSLIQKYYPKR